MTKPHYEVGKSYHTEKGGIVKITRVDSRSVFSVGKGSWNQKGLPSLSGGVTELKFGAILGEVSVTPSDYASRAARIMAICRESSDLGNQIKAIEECKSSLFAELESLMPDHLRDTDAFIAAMRRTK